MDKWALGECVCVGGFLEMRHMGWALKEVAGFGGHMGRSIWAALGVFRSLEYQGSWAWGAVGVEDPAARFPSGGRGSCPNRAFVLFLSSLQCVPPVLRCSAASLIQPERHQHEGHTQGPENIAEDREQQLK